MHCYVVGIIIGNNAQRQANADSCFRQSVTILLPCRFMQNSLCFVLCKSFSTWCGCLTFTPTTKKQASFKNENDKNSSTNIMFRLLSFPVVPRFAYFYWKSGSTKQRLIMISSFFGIRVVLLALTKHEILTWELNVGLRN